MDLSIKLGDNETLDIPLAWKGAPFEPAVGDILIFTVKSAPSDTDANALLQKLSGGGGITWAGRTATIAILHADTAALSPATAYYDVQHQSGSTGAIKTLSQGRIELKRDITRETTTSVPINVLPGGLPSSPPVIKDESFTAAINGVYHAVETLTVADPADPEDGQGYVVFVIDGTATVGGVAYAAKGTIIQRVYDDDTWRSYAYRDASSSFPPASHTHPATDISDSTATGRSLMTAANAGAARTTLGLGNAALATTSTGGNGVDDSGKVVVFNSAGGAILSSVIGISGEFYAGNITSPVSGSSSVALPSGDGTLARLEDLVLYATLTGIETLTNKTLTDPTVTNYTESPVAIGNSGASKTIDLTNGTVQTCTLTDSCTFTMPSATNGKSFVLYLKTGAGSFTAAFTGVKWPGGSAPVITATASRMDIISFVADGANWYGSIVQNYTP
jgi:hypothetical protein